MHMMPICWPKLALIPRIDKCAIISFLFVLKERGEVVFYFDSIIDFGQKYLPPIFEESKNSFKSEILNEQAVA